MIDAATVTAYLGEDSGYTPVEVASALVAETAAQAKVCRVPDPYPADLAEALKRRVQRALSLKNNPLGYQSSATEFGLINTKIGFDNEIRRYEAPYRKLVKG